MTLVYLNTSVLIAFLYEEEDQPEKHQQTQRLVSDIRTRRVSAVISFYALPELYSHVEENQPPTEINQVFRLSLVELFSLPITIVPFLERDTFSRLRQHIIIGDADDVRHVAVALDQKCDAIITFDHDFHQVANLIPAYTPAKFLTTLESPNAK